MGVVLRQVAETIARQGMFRPGERVGVAVSGGPDSVALLAALCELAPQLGILPGVVHLNHGLRGAESDADAQFTRDLAGSLRLDLVVERADVGQAGENLEQAGRRARYEFFRRLIDQNRFQKIAVGHTRTDQAETVLFRFLRGSATAGLAGIYPVLEGGIVRPLIEVDREQVLEFLGAKGLSWREDSSNASLDLARNRLRLQLLPQLARDWNPEISRTLAQVADWARDEETYWKQEIDRIAADCLRRRGSTVLVETARVREMPPAVQRRLLRRAIEQARGDLRRIGFHHVEQIRGLAAAGPGDGRLQIPGVDVFRSFALLRLAPSEPGAGLENRNFSVLLTIPGACEVPETASRFVFKLVGPEAVQQGYNEIGGVVDWERLPRPLWLRNWRPGDRYRPVGHAGPEKLKTLFQQNRVPLWERRRWPVIVAGDPAGQGQAEARVIWSRTFGVEAEYQAGRECRLALEILEQPRDLEAG